MAGAPEAFSAPLLLAEEMRAAEARWFAAGNDSYALMERAASAVTEVAVAMLAAPATVLVVVGPGNNGGDGFVVARLLRERGYEVAVQATKGARRGDAARAEAAWWALEPREPRESWEPAFRIESVELVIDALFGIGLSRPLAGEAAALVAQMNSLPAPVLAIDMPTGIDSDTGEVWGCAVRATRTVTFHTAKPGHFLLPGRQYAGALQVADIGLPPAPALVGVNRPQHWPVPDVATSKYARGGALFWCGPPEMTAPARLAAYGALRAGAGAALIVGTPDAIAVAATQATAPILMTIQEATEFAGLLARRKWRAACIGPGGGPKVRAVVEAALQKAAGKSLLLDADALTAFAGVANTLSALLKASGAEVVLTPHEGEFAALFPMLEGGRLQRAREGARRLGGVVVLKGGDTVVAAPDGRAVINDNAPPTLATAGSGDALAGFITGFLAQGMAAFEAACAGVYLHGAVGTHLGPGVVADDLVGPEMRPVIAGLLRRPD